jgi:Cd2+/Zn2+-exporting ATPase
MASASKKGVLIKGAAYLENFNKIKYCLFDKTGTLTNGSFKVTAIHPEKITEAELLRIAAAAESLSDHPISVSLVSAYGKIPDIDVKNVTELSGEGIKASVEGKEVLIGNERLMQEQGIEITFCSECDQHSHRGSTVHIAIDNEYMGHIVLSDQIKVGAKETVVTLKKAGIKTVMLSGDKEEIAKAVAKELNIDEVYAGLLPTDKVVLAEKLMDEKGEKEIVAFVGDGINDAPVLMRADVGISMGAMGSDAAIEAADIVIMDDSIEKLIATKKIARSTMNIVKENIISAIGIKIVVLLLGAFMEIPMALAIFADVGITILATLNASRTMFLGKK